MNPWFSQQSRSYPTRLVMLKGEAEQEYQHPGTLFAKIDKALRKNQWGKAAPTYKASVVCEASEVYKN
jgi:hypothetical protein